MSHRARTVTQPGSGMYNRARAHFPAISAPLARLSRANIAEKDSSRSAFDGVPVAAPAREPECGVADMLQVVAPAPTGAKGSTDGHYGRRSALTVTITSRRGASAAPCPGALNGVRSAAWSGEVVRTLPRAQLPGVLSYSLCLLCLAWQVWDEYNYMADMTGQR